MPDWVGNGSTRAARRVHLYDFLRARHPGDVILEGSSWLRLARDRSVVVSKIKPGYIDYATGETGNAVDLLVKHLEYEFRDAVAELCDYLRIPADTISLKDRTDCGYPGGSAGAPVNPPAAGQAPPPPGAPPAAAPRPFAPPPPVQGPYARLFGYLVHQRGIPAGLIQELVDRKLLYQDAGHGNAVFIDMDRTYAELRGTVPDRPFHGLAPGSNPEGFWWFKPGGPNGAPTGAFICEGAIDALSLYLLRQRLPLPPGDDPMYCSIGGVANQKRIDRIKAIMDSAGLPTTLAVDNDPAGEKCRQRNPGCYTLVPRLKDWNAVLLSPTPTLIA